MTDKDPLALENQLCFSLYATSLAITQFYKPLLEPLGLTYPQYLVMLILWKQDGVPLIEIARQLGQKPGALTPVLKRMAEEGFLTRDRSATDERELEIHLTKKGIALRDEALVVNRCLFEKSSLSSSRLLEIKADLDALRTRIQA